MAKVMFDVTTNLRLPSFLEGVNFERKVESAGFLAEYRKVVPAPAAEVKPMPIPEEVGELAPPEPEPVVAEMLPPEPPPPPPPPPIIDMSRMEAAIDRLRLLADRLAAEARSDALELGLMVARKVVEGELAVNADRLIGIVKSAVSKVGDSRRIVVHLAPEDAAVLNGETASEEPGKTRALTPAERLGKGAARVEVVADATLSRGDCLVEGDHLSVDARLDAKFAEIRRALLESAWEDEG